MQLKIRIIWHCDLFQTCTVQKSTRSNRNHTVRNCNTRQTSAPIERVVSNCGYISFKNDLRNRIIHTIPWRIIIAIIAIIIHFPITTDRQCIGFVCIIVIVLGQNVGNIVATTCTAISTLNSFSIFRPRRYGIHRQNCQHHTEGQYHAEQSFFHKNPPFCKNPKILFSAPTANTKSAAPAERLV